MQQSAGASDRAPLKGAAQASKGPAKGGDLTKSTALALGAAAVLLIAAAAGGITWYRAGVNASLLHIAHKAPESCEPVP